MKKTAKEVDILLSGWLEDLKKKMNSTSTRQADESSEQPVFMAAVLSRVKEEVKEEVYGFSTEDIVKATCLLGYSIIPRRGQNPNPTSNRIQDMMLIEWS
ncbi:hypothetical protein L1987_80398 [Smallanthus sonchifolius]|uniref:Uncharacterized protein n=1 Tax=Smallanthus sonchifolius TaxID=185202 RepID=A0ACB8YLT7_9ASTR|nr:hypothetical protein L1987_80398 [Smallanthus sonchifolius]